MNAENRIDRAEIPETDAARARVVKPGAKSSRALLLFAGGRRFHFIDPAGRKYAIRYEAGVEQEIRG